VYLIGLVESPDHVCSRYRLRAFRDYFEADGHRLDLRPLGHGWWDRLRAIADVGHADAVILQRKLLPSWQLRLLRHRARRLIFDFDDAVFLRDSYAAKGMDSPVRRRRFAAIVRAADAVVAGNDWLADRARAAGNGGLMSVIPSCVEPSNYSRAKHTAISDGVRLVWVGSSSTLNGLEQVRGLLSAIGTAAQSVSLKLISDRFPKFGQLEVESCPWSEQTEAAEIAASDVGIAWMPDDDWSQGKCGLKVLQYMAAGLPVIANPVGMHSQLIRNGETGLLATTPSEWIDAVQRLAGDFELRRRMGALARWCVEADYSVAAGARRWRELLGRLAGRQRAAG
jgi:glycosyltransferase involved in cell wall biosynthesis